MTNTEEDFYDRAGIVHRIDKETSGILLIAKTREAFIELQRQFKQREVKKIYLALVHGKLVPDQGEIRAPVGRLPWNQQRFGVVPEGKEAVTKYKVTKTWDEMSLVELYPETGRTHQIRVHFLAIDHPLVGDRLYKKPSMKNIRPIELDRIFLHSHKLRFKLMNGTEKTFEEPLPHELENLLQTLQI